MTTSQDEEREFDKQADKQKALKKKQEQAEKQNRVYLSEKQLKESK